MTLLELADVRLLQVLNCHPELKRRLEMLTRIVEDADGDLEQADEAERRVIEEVRRLGQETLQAWAEGQVERSTTEAGADGRARRAGKKNSAGTPRSETLR